MIRETVRQCHPKQYPQRTVPGYGSDAEVNLAICEFCTNPHYGEFDKINPPNSAQKQGNLK